MKKFSFNKVLSFADLWLYFHPLWFFIYTYIYISTFDIYTNQTVHGVKSYGINEKKALTGKTKYRNTCM